ncbi:MAG: FecR domain-containing protein [Candidatus Pseudobacter hemicellulosilyticus]|uniref:FecR domain-containing protein n=1 Tax=Candidatus Pseudobacter hemicellulosilyticus TaxID=3121375 RepID=A0AAJ6BHR2_9BACT|nr:MAG: FecR domain-containing protein [Pseudobacter sp.]
MRTGQELTANEQEELDQWRAVHPGNQAYFDILDDPEAFTEEFLQYARIADTYKDLEPAIGAAIPADPPVMPVAPVIPLYKKWLPWVAAAVVALLLVPIIYLILPSSPADTAKADQPSGMQQESLPAVQQATLTLANNEQIRLNEAPVGRITAEQGAAVEKRADGSLVYSAAGGNALHTLTTPRGGFYHLTLSDGTKVWLNAASSLRFPAGFTGTARKVTLSGEAYFDVAAKKGMPFLVETERGIVEVLGTQFNIRDYPEDVMATTLVQGAVKLAVASSDQQPVLMAPGQQALIREKTGLVQLVPGNIQHATAWRRGVFSFQEMDLRQIMQELSRWYDVEIRFEPGIITSEVYMGELDRTLSLPRLLVPLAKMSSLEFRLQGKTVIVSH